MIIKGGVIGTGTPEDPYRPAVVDHLPPDTGWALVHDDRWDDGQEPTELTVDIRGTVDLAAMPAGVVTTVEAV